MKVIEKKLKKDNIFKMVAVTIHYNNLIMIYAFHNYVKIIFKIFNCDIHLNFSIMRFLLS